MANHIVNPTSALWYYLEIVMSTSFLTYRLRLELIFMALSYLGILLEVILGIITLWIFQK